jgi:hypothetical protein
MPQPPSAQREILGPVLAIVIVLGLTAAVLHSEGRLWICGCGFAVWTSQVCSAYNSQQLLDPYSFTHVLHGFLYCWLILMLFPRLRPAWQLWLAVLIGSLWEIFENSDFIIQRYRDTTAALGYQGDTIVNSLGDISCCVLGFMLAQQLGWRRSLIAFFAIEAILIFWIRDSLVLEIVMLAHPVSAIKVWQMCR